MTTQESSSVPSVDYTPPYSNCKYKLCDLPGQCRKEGKCHHPRRTEPSPAEVGSETAPRYLPAYGTYDFEWLKWAVGEARGNPVEWDESYFVGHHPAHVNNLNSLNRIVTAAVTHALSQQPPARVEGELTDEGIIQIATECDLWCERGSVWMALGGTIELLAFARALNQRLAVKEGDDDTHEELASLRYVFQCARRFLRFNGVDRTKASSAVDELDDACEQMKNFDESRDDTPHPVSDDQQAKDAALLDLLSEAKGYVPYYVESLHQRIDAALSTTKQEG